MPSMPPARLRAAIIARLRAAGCVYAEDEADLLIAAAATAGELSGLVERRVGGLPLEQILGWARFGGLRVQVATGVFVPRARTELVVRQAVALLDAYRAGAPTLVDLCCGSGAIAAAIAAVGGAVRVYAADIDPAAVACARANLARYGGQVYLGDLFAALPERLRGQVDILVANVPYVPTAQLSRMPAEARLHEPRVALDGGGDGLDVLRRVAAQSPDWLAPGGHLIIETSRAQAPTAAAVFAAAGLVAAVVHDDDIDATAVTGAR